MNHFSEHHLYCLVNSTFIFVVIIGVEFLWNIFQASIILSRNQNPPRLLCPVGNRWVKRGNKLGKKPKEKENVEFKNNEDEKIRIIQFKEHKAKLFR